MNASAGERRVGRTRLVYNKARKTIVIERRFWTWGKHGENGFWIASVSDWRWMWRRHDALYIAAGRLRLRIMKRAAPGE